MNKRQKAVLRNFASVTLLTFLAIIALTNFRNHINLSEATRAMNHLSAKVQDYRQKNGMVPPESYIETIRPTLQGGARLGDLIYRARWIDYDSTDDEILAYAKNNRGVLFKKRGSIVLRLGGEVEWIEARQFNKILSQQQSKAEIEMIRELE